MALTFTSTLEAATAGAADVRTMLFGAFGCNLAWGIVDGVMFVVTRLVESHRLHAWTRALQAAAPQEAHRMLEQELPADWASLLESEDVERLAQRIRARPPSSPPGLAVDDLLGGLTVCVLVLLSTLPVAIPFLLFDQLYLAARVSDATALVMLFLIGTRLGSHAGRRPLLVGLTMLVLGAVLCAVAIRLGG